MGLITLYNVIQLSWEPLALARETKIKQQKPTQTNKKTPKLINRKTINPKTVRTT